MKKIIPIIFLSALLNCKTVPIVNAAKANSIDLVKLEIENKADVNQKDYQTITALHYAIKNKNIEMAKMLIKAGADVNLTTASNVAPLHSAVTVDSPEIISLLIKEKADVNVRTVEGNTPLLLAARYNLTQSAKVLIQAKPELNFKAYYQEDSDKTALSWAVKNKNVELIKALIAAKVDVNEGQPLFWARIVYASNEITELLTKAGAKD